MQPVWQHLVQPMLVSHMSLPFLDWPSQIYLRPSPPRNAKPMGAMLQELGLTVVQQFALF
jgi:hypothetical protein